MFRQETLHHYHHICAKKNLRSSTSLNHKDKNAQNNAAAVAAAADKPAARRRLKNDQPIIPFYCEDREVLLCGNLILKEKELLSAVKSDPLV